MIGWKLVFEKSTSVSKAGLLSVENVLNSRWRALENKGYDIFEKDKDKDNILVDNILGILLEDIFRQLILQRIRIKDSIKIFKDNDKDKDFWAIREVYGGSNIEFRIYLLKLCFS